MRMTVSARTTQERPDVLSPLVNEVKRTEDAALFEVFLLDRTRLPFNEALNLVVDNVIGLDFGSSFVVVSERGGTVVFWVDLAAGVSTVLAQRAVRS